MQGGHCPPPNVNRRAVPALHNISSVVHPSFRLPFRRLAPIMSPRIFNFSAGPAMLPTEVLEKSAAALLDFQGKGFGIAEVSHRGKEFEAVADEAILRCKQLLGLGDSHDVLFLQGGATQMFTIIPMNFL